jgi:hypothetical protein
VIPAGYPDAAETEDTGNLFLHMALSIGTDDT